MRYLGGLVLLMALSYAGASQAACELRSRVGSLDLATASLTDLSAALERGQVSSVLLVKQYLRRIEVCDRELNAILALNPRAIEMARHLDQERRAGKLRGPLHGLPIAIKDNIDVAGMVTTAGSLALVDNLRARNAPWSNAWKPRA